MTSREFIQAKFGLFLLTFVAVYFTSISMVCLVLAARFPTLADIFISMADWSTKAAVGPLVGALINSIVTPHDSPRREDSADYLAGNVVTRHVETTEDVVPKVPSPAPDPKAPIVVQKIQEPVVVKAEGQP